jgi:hypothetical protein
MSQHRIAMHRRSLLAGLAAVVAAPVIVRASVLTDEIRALADQIKQKADAIDAGQPPPPPPPGSAIITWPLPNQVIQKNGNVASFTVTWQGDAAGVDIRNGATLIASSATGAFTNVPYGWYTLNLLDAGGAVLHSIKFGVGSVIIVLGQSNAVSAAEVGYTTQANTPGKCIIGQMANYDPAVVASGAEELSIRFSDAAVEPVSYNPTYGNAILSRGMAYIHLINALNLPFPVCFLIGAVGATLIQDWNSAAYRRRTEWLIDEFHPRSGYWTQGESQNLVSDIAPANVSFYTSQMHSLVQHWNSRDPNIRWAVSLNANPSADDWAIVHGQKAVISGFGGPYSNIALGINMTLLGSYGVPRIRNLNEVHYEGPRHQVYAVDGLAVRLPNVYPDWLF